MATLILTEFFLRSTDKESFMSILDPDADPDDHQNLITSNLVKVHETFSQILPVTFCVIMLTDTKINAR